MIRLDLYVAPSTRATDKSITSPSLTLTEKKRQIYYIKQLNIITCCAFFDDFSPLIRNFDP